MPASFTVIPFYQLRDILAYFIVSINLITFALLVHLEILFYKCEHLFHQQFIVINLFVFGGSQVFSVFFIYVHCCVILFVFKSIQTE
ncbi:hypothetical protein BDB01DRAFT_801826 [Pilobolus umbonatus]|nr:hypothetical protein BDB01DRAFT_801826 [Pilobolus umbonatus]